VQVLLLVRVIFEAFDSVPCSRSPGVSAWLVTIGRHAPFALPARCRPSRRLPAETPLVEAQGCFLHARNLFVRSLSGSDDWQI